MEVIRAQRACRWYAPDPVPPDAVVTMLEAASHAPSAENRQPWVFVVVADRGVRHEVDEVTRRAWAAAGRAHAEATLAPSFFTDVDRFMAVGYGGAPLLVVVAGDGRDGSSRSLLAGSVFPAIQNLLLAAAALGYGASMTTLAAVVPGPLAAAVGLPEGVHPFAVVPIGRPRRPLGPPRRRPVPEVAHLDRFGTPFDPSGVGAPWS